MCAHHLKHFVFIFTLGITNQAFAGTPFQEFLTQKLCLNAAGQVTDGVPGKDTCASTRAAKDNERMPYVLQTFGSVAEQDTCTKKDGWIRKINVPVTINGVTHTGSFFDKGFSEDCKKKNDEKVFASMKLKEEDKVSLYTVADGYASILYSLSSEGGTFYHNPNSSKDADRWEQFANGWILARKTVPNRKPTGEASVRGVVTKAAKYADSENSVKSMFNNFGEKPSQYRQYLTLWARADFKYQSNDVLDTVVSFHYSSSDGKKLHPGGGASLERIYFAKDIGMMRWEIWKREDYYKVEGQAKAKAQNYMTNINRCSKPFDLPNKPTAHMKTSGVMLKDGAYAERVVKVGDAKSSHYWYMTECFDYSNFKKNSDLVKEKNYNKDGYLPAINNMMTSDIKYFFK